MATGRRSAASVQAASPCRRSQCVPAATARYAAGAAQRRRVLTVTAWIAAVTSGSFGALQLLTGHNLWWIGAINVLTAVILLAIPMLYRYGEFVAPLTFVAAAYTSIFVVCWAVGTGSGLQFFFLVAASIVVLILGVEHVALAAVLAGLGAGLAIVLQFLVPADTGAQPPWLLRLGFVMVVVAACLLGVATVWVALREIARAEAAMESEYQRSESLLTNILPVSIADRLKNPARDVIADRYDDASILFADIADFTEHASDTTPADLVRFLDLLYTDFDLLVDKHRLEKIKTSGDSYMVVSGVPEPRADHLAALANFALDMAHAAAVITTPDGSPLRIRIGLAAGPVVAGVVGSRRFFYDVWGDAVNVAARMESTDTEGRIQVPHNVYDRLRHDFVFEERGEIAVKGKGIMHTWYLVGRNPDADAPTRDPAFARSH